ncbi:signal transduction histidine kinase [Paenibacillus shirakamiensis]|uniref:histidine kinase n=1 Tax=Paenibacillus shirakamiensis TaxID=1265935 RepID=A0ABS4JL01_9BACL|nr:sensor histidine kinase [Paenibacillus shirakamiensis]MBP2002388.1 signal transduction histidine kinase [Paenibacillus shirakamiensis]
MPIFHFRTNAKVENLVGRELITNNIIAIFELIKNSYDAGATRIEIKLNDFLPPSEKFLSEIISTSNSNIEIIDNGVGMTTREIEEYWMELGTSHKEKERTGKARVRRNEIDMIVSRTVNGEKGIGRFGVDKIGAYLNLLSVDQDRKTKTEVHFNWNDFDDRNKLIEQIPCEYQVHPVSHDDLSGTKLTIKKLRDDWTNLDIIKLKRSLKKFLSPIYFEQDEFRIFLSYSYYENGEVIQSKEEIVNDSFDYLKTSLSAELSTDGMLNYYIEDNLEIEKRESIKLYSSSSFGEVSVKIFYLDPQDKNIFTRKMGIRPADYGNIKIFRDNFRVMPYGEPNNDWLGIDKIHSYGFFRTFGTRDLIGHISLSHDPEKKNEVLKEATDRVGLIEDVAAFEDLKEFVWYLIKIFQNYVFNRIKTEAREVTKVLKDESSNLKREASGILDSFKEILNQSDLSIENQARYNDLDLFSREFIKRIDTVDRASREIESKIKIFSQITSKEGILFEMLHAIKNKLSVIDSQLRDFKDEALDQGVTINTKILELAFDDIYKLVTGALDKVNHSKLKKETILVNSIITESLDFHKSKLREEGIEIVTNFNTAGYQVRCSPDSIKSVLENLFSNAFKALSTSQQKIINIESKVAMNNVEIYFSDSGVGILEEKIPFIFSLWSSDTNGSGVGLASAKDIMEDHNGEILYVDMEEKNKKTTFLLRLPVA